jgi:hypothetical protein
MPTLWKGAGGMTDRTPTTEAGRRLDEWIGAGLRWEDGGAVSIHADILAIEDEARAGSFERGTLTADYIAKKQDEARAPLVAALEDIRDLYTNDNIRPASFAVRAGEIAVAALSREDRP